MSAKQSGIGEAFNAIFWMGVVFLILVGLATLGANVEQMGSVQPAPQAMPPVAVPAVPAQPQPAAPLQYDLPSDVSEHAIERHGQDAMDAYYFVQSVQPDQQRCKWSCSDGRTRYVCLNFQTGIWAVVVQEADRIVTAFWTRDSKYANRVTQGCQLVP
jgi:hypothetical protein